MISHFVATGFYSLYYVNPSLSFADLSSHEMVNVTVYNSALAPTSIPTRVSFVFLSDEATVSWSSDPLTAVMMTKLKENYLQPSFNDAVQPPFYLNQVNETI